MRIECSGCGSVYNVRITGKARRAKCKECDGVLAIPATAAKTAVDPLADPPSAPARHQSRSLNREERAARRETARPPLSITAIVVVVVSFLLGAVFLPLALVLGLDFAVVVASGEASEEATATVGWFLALAATVAGILVLGGVGLLLRKAWGWWASILVYVFFILLVGRVGIIPLFDLNWSHPRAIGIAVAFGAPFLLAVAMVVLLSLPRMRIAYGVSAEKRPVRRRQAGRISTGR